MPQRQCRGLLLRLLPSCNALIRNILGRAVFAPVGIAHREGAGHVSSHSMPDAAPDWCPDVFRTRRAKRLEYQFMAMRFASAVFLTLMGSTVLASAADVTGPYDPAPAPAQPAAIDYGGDDFVFELGIKGVVDPEYLGS